MISGLCRRQDAVPKQGRHRQGVGGRALFCEGATLLATMWGCAVLGAGETGTARAMGHTAWVVRRGRARGEPAVGFRRERAPCGFTSLPTAGTGLVGQRRREGAGGEQSQEAAAGWTDRRCRRSCSGWSTRIRLENPAREPPSTLAAECASPRF